MLFYKASKKVKVDMNCLLVCKKWSCIYDTNQKAALAQIELDNPGIGDGKQCKFVTVSQMLLLELASISMFNNGKVQLA